MLLPKKKGARPPSPPKRRQRLRRLSLIEAFPKFVYNKRIRLPLQVHSASNVAADFVTTTE